MAAKGEETRQKIIDKSLQLFSVKGYFNTSVNDILVSWKQRLRRIPNATE